MQDPEATVSPFLPVLTTHGPHCLVGSRGDPTISCPYWETSEYEGVPWQTPWGNSCKL